MPFIKTLSRANGDYTLTATANPSNNDNAAITVASMIRRDRFMDVESLSLAPGATVQLTKALPDRIIRIIVWVNMPIPDIGSVNEVEVQIFQPLGGGLFQVPVQVDKMFVFDVGP